MTSIVDHFLIWWLRSARYPWSRLRRRLFEGGYKDRSLPAAHSLADIETCLREITWTMDGPLHLFDSISYPQTVWAKKKDDCDGFAILAATLLRQWHPDWHPVLITAMVRPMQASHTVCGFLAPDGLAFFDNASLRGECQTYGDIVNKISLNAKRLVCWDVRDPLTLGLVEFHVA